MFKSLFLLKNDSKKRKFRRLSNKLNKTIAFVKKSYFNKILDKNKHNAKKTWQILQSVLPTSSNKLPAITTREQKEPKTVVNSFNTFFCNFGKKLADKILDNENHSFLNYLSNRVSQSIYLKPPQLNKIINSIHSLNVNKSIGHDNIPAFPLKIIATTIAPYVLCFFDFSFSRRIFPENGTLAKVIPIHKKGNKIDPNNYRPISFMTRLSKILERL